MAPLDEFLSHAALEAGEGQADEWEDCVQLMTLHSAKGLEFPVVFLCGMEDGLFPHQRTMQDAGGLEEERRLCYVGMTRAERWLMLCHATRRLWRGKVRPAEPSPFLRDIASQLVMKWERMNSDDVIDVPKDMIRLTLDTIGVCGFGYRFNSFYREDFHPLIAALTRTLETTQKLRGIPGERLIKRQQLEQLNEDARYMNNLVDEIIAERRNTGGDRRPRQPDPGPVRVTAGRH